MYLTKLFGSLRKKSYLYFGDTFKLKRFAVHYLLDIIQSEYREEDYRTEQITGGAIYCYKSELTAEKKRKAIEWTI